jgi:hypothetical protein
MGMMAAQSTPEVNVRARVVSRKVGEIGERTPVPGSFMGE